MNDKDQANNTLEELVCYKILTKENHMVALHPQFKKTFETVLDVHGYKHKTIEKDIDECVIIAILQTVKYAQEDQLHEFFIGVRNLINFKTI